MVSIVESVGRGDILLTDGGLGTMLLERFPSSGDCLSLLCLEHPEQVLKVSRRFVEAGADIVQTNTFGASPIRLDECGLDKRMVDINRVAVSIARKAAGRDRYVAASIGPTGLFAGDSAEAKLDQAIESYTGQIAVLVSEGVDLLLAETLSSVYDAQAVIEAAKQSAPSIPLAISFHFIRKRGVIQTLAGSTAAQLAEVLSPNAPDLVGTNCGDGIDLAIAIVGELRESFGQPLICRPNAGQPDRISTGRGRPGTPEGMARGLVDLLGKGVRVVGGCCGTTPEHIAAFRTVVDTWPGTLPEAR